MALTKRNYFERNDKGAVDKCQTNVISCCNVIFVCINERKEWRNCYKTKRNVS